MKFLKIAILFSALFSGGCIREDIDGCDPSVSMTLLFRYTDANNNNIFPGAINKVDLVLFDASGHFAVHLPVDKAALTAFQGAKLQLLPGIYHVVCWGNAAGHTSPGAFDASMTMDNAFLLFTSPEDGDPLYYAPRGAQLYTLTVPAEGAAEQTIDFTPAHNLIDVYVQNYTGSGSDALPKVEITGLPRGYDYRMQPLGGQTAAFAHSTATKATTDGVMANAVFFSTNFKTDNSIDIIIKRPSDGVIIHTVNLNDFLAENSLTLTGQNNKTTTIVIKFTNTGVQCILPLWAETGIKPGFD